jgi:succinate dehydrogenase / fumarate reductase cytochrome b subunit
MSKEGRPLSPHLTIYRWPITMILSILHRISGIALAVGFVAFAVWLEAIAFESVSFETYSMVMQSFIGQVALFGWLFCFFFHMSNGIRHLVWDSGRLFEKHQANVSAWVVLVAAIVLSAGYWALV